jgi:hypothetical protein
MRISDLNFVTPEDPIHPTHLDQFDLAAQMLTDRQDGGIELVVREHVLWHLAAGLMQLDPHPSSVLGILQPKNLSFRLPGKGRRNGGALICTHGGVVSP